MKEFAAKKDLAEGDEAFDSLVGKVLSAPREEILRRQAQHKATMHLRGKKRGPKPKRPVSAAPADDSEQTSEQPEA